MTPQAEQPAVRRPAKRKRWGLRTLGFLLLGMLAVVVSSAQGYHSIGTMGCTLIGLGGAAYCSVRGWRAMESNEWSKFIRRR